MNGEHFKLGLFVIAATALLVIMLFLLGTLDRLRPKVVVTTYFAEPIVGLQPGATVRYRGVGVGSVGSIQFVRDAEFEAGQARDAIGKLIRVRMNLDPASSESIRSPEFPDQVQAAVGRGLRARLTASGLGGPPYIELDYIDPSRETIVSLPPTEGIVIPSTPSTMRTLVAGLERLLTDVNDSNLVTSLASLAGLAPELQAVLGELQEGDVVESLSTSLADLRSLAASLETQLADDRLAHVLDDATETLEVVRAFAEDGRTDLEELTPRIVATADALESASTAADALVASVVDAELVAELRSAAQALGPAGTELAVMADRLEHLVTSSEPELTQTIRALRRSVQRLDAVLEEAEANPSRLLFGDPPPRRAGDRP